jgi:transcriptional antiterminator RfaH
MSDSSSPLFSGPQGKVWYLLYCKAKEEGRAVMHLANQDIQAFYPKAKITKILRGKRQTVEEALFPNYVFAQLDHDIHNFTSVRSTRGVIGFVKQGKDYQKVPLKLITLFRDGMEYPDTEISLPKTGDKVVIEDDQYNNIPAIFKEYKGETRSILLIQLLNQSVEIEVDNTKFVKK